MRSHRVTILAAAVTALWTVSPRMHAAPSFATEDIALPWRTLDVHGPTSLSQFDLATLGSPSGSAGEVETKPTSPCTDANPCFAPSSDGDGVGEQTPVPTTWFAHRSLSASNMDTTIAVGKSYVMVSSRDSIAVYDKQGNVLGPKYKSLTQLNPPKFTDVKFPNPFTVQSLFDHLTDEINQSYALPAGLPPGVTIANGFGIDDYHDNRVLYDPYRDRFWIVSFGQSGKLRIYIERLSTGSRPCVDYFSSDPASTNCGEQVLWQYPAFGTARRGYLVVAVSKTSDPRDGFYLYWWDGDIKDGTCDTLEDSDLSDSAKTPCHDVLKFGWQGPDYPTIGITDKHLLVANVTGYKDPSKTGNDTTSAAAWISCTDPACGAHSYEHGVIAPADALAAGLPTDCGVTVCPPAMGWHFAAYHELHPVTGRGLRPVTAHDHVPFGLPLFANIFGETDAPRVIVWAFDILDPNHAFIRLSVDVAGYTSPNFFGIMNAVFRNQEFYTTWDSKDDLGYRVIRLVRFDLLDPANPQFIDETFGGYNVIDDNPLVRVHYLFPSVDVNKDGTIALVYNRFLADNNANPLAQEVRYSVRSRDPGQFPTLVRPSRLIKAGELTATDYIGPDTVGIGVDPFDDRGIWMAHIYADAEDSRNQRIAVARVFGITLADIDLRPFIFELFGQRTIRFDGTLLNHGDARAHAGVLHVYLSTDGVLDANDIRVATIGFRPLDPGEELAIASTAAINPRTPAGAYYLFARAESPEEEYSLENNVAPVISASPQLCVGERGELTIGVCGR